MRRVFSCCLPCRHSDVGLELRLSKLRDDLDGFTTEYLKDKSEETVGTYRRSLRAFEKWFIQYHGRFCFPELEEPPATAVKGNRRPDIRSRGCYGIGHCCAQSRIGGRTFHRQARRGDRPFDAARRVEQKQDCPR